MLYYRVEIPIKSAICGTLLKVSNSYGGKHSRQLGIIFFILLYGNVLLGQAFQLDSSIFQIRKSQFANGITMTDYLLNNYLVISERYYPNGQRQSFETININREKNGVGLYWYNSGQIEVVCNYICDRLLGPYVSYYANGNRKEVGQYWIDIAPEKISFYNPVIDTIIDSNSNKIIVRSKDEIKDGKWFYYSEDGTLINIETYHQGKLIP